MRPNTCHRKARIAQVSGLSEKNWAGARGVRVPRQPALSRHLSADAEIAAASVGQVILYDGYLSHLLAAGLIDANRDANPAQRRRVGGHRVALPNVVHAVI